MIYEGFFKRTMMVHPDVPNIVDKFTYGLKISIKKIKPSSFLHLTDHRLYCRFAYRGSVAGSNGCLSLLQRIVIGISPQASQKRLAFSPFFSVCATNFPLKYAATENRKTQMNFLLQIIELMLKPKQVTSQISKCFIRISNFLINGMRSLEVNPHYNLTYSYLSIKLYF